MRERVRERMQSMGRCTVCREALSEAEEIEATCKVKGILSWAWGTRPDAMCSSSMPLLLTRPDAMLTLCAAHPKGSTCDALHS